MTLISLSLHSHLFFLRQLLANLCPLQSCEQRTVFEGITDLQLWNSHFQGKRYIMVMLSLQHQPLPCPLPSAESPEACADIFNGSHFLLPHFIYCCQLQCYYLKDVCVFSTPSFSLGFNALECHIVQMLNVI